MATEHYAAMGADYRKEAERLIPKVLLAALLLLLSHLLDLKVSEFDAGGLKVAVKDVIVIRGGLALIFLYYFYALVNAMLTGTVLLPLRSEQRMLRWLVATAKRPYRDEKIKKLTRRRPTQVKRYVWWRKTAYLSFILPFALTIFAIVFIALTVGLYDAWGFGSYLFERIVQMNLV